MPGSGRKRRAISRLGALLTLLAWAALAPRPAEAGCVHDRATLTHFEHLSRAGALADPAHGDHVVPKALPTCDGPNCARPPIVPAGASWTVPGASDSWAILVALLEPPGLAAAPLPRDEDDEGPEGRKLSVFHPPMVASS